MVSLWHIVISQQLKQLRKHSWTTLEAGCMQAGSDLVTGTATEFSHILGFTAACGVDLLDLVSNGVQKVCFVVGRIRASLVRCN